MPGVYHVTWSGMYHSAWPCSAFSHDNTLLISEFQLCHNLPSISWNWCWKFSFLTPLFSYDFESSHISHVQMNPSASFHNFWLKCTLSIFHPPLYPKFALTWWSTWVTTPGARIKDVHPMHYSAWLRVRVSANRNSVKVEALTILKTKQTIKKSKQS